MSPDQKPPNERLQSRMRRISGDNVKDPATPRNPDEIPRGPVGLEPVENVFVPELGPNEPHQAFLGNRPKPGEMAGRFGEVRCDFTSLHL